MDIHADPIIAVIRGLHERSTNDELLQEAVYMMVELLFENDTYNRRERLKYLTADDIPMWLTTVQNIALEVGVTWTVIRREGGKSWSEEYLGFSYASHLIPCLLEVSKLNQNDSSYYYMVVTSRRAELIIAHYRKLEEVKKWTLNSY